MGLFELVAREQQQARGWCLHAGGCWAAIVLSPAQTWGRVQRRHSDTRAHHPPGARPRVPRRDQAEAVRSELATFSPAMKLTFLSNIGSLVTMIAFGVSWITGEDPLGALVLKQGAQRLPLL